MSLSVNIIDEIREIEKSLSDVSKQVLQDEEARKRLLGVLEAQVAALESPLEVVWRMMMEVRYLVCGRYTSSILIVHIHSLIKALPSEPLWQWD